MSTTPARVESLFADALARPPAEREAFLVRECGDDSELLQWLIAMIAAHEGTASLRASAPLREESLCEILHEERPDYEISLSAGALAKVGHYKLLQKIGEGGCGVVWMAEQEEPVRRRVALKIIKLGMDTKAVVARFEAERQALALMDHPCIAKVYDAGATETGRPYFVMELVRGIPITKYCDENHLTPEQRLELFIKVCQAIQHAHQKGVIHRDIKPSNILVTVNDGAPTPKVIDFGIAKATQGRLTDATVFTAFEQFIGTPVYMSPEQAEMSSLDIDTRSDIYSLGVLLYELLTGKPPFDPKAFAQAGVDQIRQQIREVEPPRPSARLRTLDDDERTTIARLRGTAESQLSIVLRGDLDWIVMRCIEKDRTRRYDTANGLAMDIQRYLRNEPVVARPPSTAYLVQKLIRRHRLVFFSGAVVGVALVAGFGVSVWSLLKERAARDQARAAEQAERTMRQRAESAEKAGAEARAQSQDVLSFMLTDLSKELELFGLSQVLNEASERAVSYYETLPPSLKNAETEVGYGRALAISAAVLDAQGDPQAAEKRFTQALNHLTVPATADPAYSARLARAEALVKYAWFKFSRLDYAAELEHARAAELVLAPVLAAPGFKARAHQVLSEALRQQATALQFSDARVTEPVSLHERAIAMADAADRLASQSKYRGLTAALHAAPFSESLFEAGAYGRSQEIGRRAFETLHALITRHPNLWSARVWAGFARHYDSRVSFDEWDEINGRKHAQEAIAILREAVARDPHAQMARLIYAFMGSGDVFFLRANGEWERALDTIREMDQRYESAGTNHKLQVNRAVHCADAAEILAAMGRDADAEERLHAARVLFQASMASLEPGSDQRVFREAWVEMQLRRTALQRLDYARVRASAKSGLRALEKVPVTMIINHKDDGDPRAITYYQKGQADFFSGHYAEAVQTLEAAAAARKGWWSERALVRGAAKSRQDRADAAEIELYRVHSLARIRRLADARAAFRAVWEEIEALSEQRPDLWITQRLAARALWVRTETEELSPSQRRQDFERAARLYRNADSDGRLNRIEREIILPEIEKSIARAMAEAP